MVILLVGVPATGKTWVCDRAKGHYNVVEHDTYGRGLYAEAIKSAARGHKDVLAEAPFNAASLRDELRRDGIRVQEWLVTAPLDEVKARYAARAGKVYPANFETNHARYEADNNRFEFKGPSSRILTALKALAAK